MAAIAFNCPRLRCPALALRQAGPWLRKSPQPQAQDAAWPKAAHALGLSFFFSIRLSLVGPNPTWCLDLHDVSEIAVQKSAEKAGPD
jgi:hypothetical protein